MGGNPRLQFFEASKRFSTSLRNKKKITHIFLQKYVLAEKARIAFNDNKTYVLMRTPLSKAVVKAMSSRFL